MLLVLLLYCTYSQSGVVLVRPRAMILKRVIDHRLVVVPYVVQIRGLFIEPLILITR